MVGHFQAGIRLPLVPGMAVVDWMGIFLLPENRGLTHCSQCGIFANIGFLNPFRRLAQRKIQVYAILLRIKALVEYGPGVEKREEFVWETFCRMAADDKILV
jgi:hypothetical protein